MDFCHFVKSVFFGRIQKLPMNGRKPGGKRGGLMVTALVLGAASGPGLSPGRGRCFLGQDT